MNSDNLIKINLDNAKVVANGVYTGLYCPKCKKQSVEAFFSDVPVRICIILVAEFFFTKKEAITAM